MVSAEATPGGPDSVQVDQWNGALRLRWAGLRGDAIGVRVYRDGVLVAELVGAAAEFTDGPRTRDTTYELVAFGSTGEGQREHRVRVGANGVQTSSQRSTSGGSISTSQRSTIRRS